MEKQPARGDGKESNHSSVDNELLNQPAPSMESLKEMLRQKDELEREVSELLQVLTGPGGLGLTGGLVDKEGAFVNSLLLSAHFRLSNP